MLVAQQVSEHLVAKPTGNPRRLLVHHVAGQLGLSRRMVRHLAKAGRLRAFKIGPKIWHFLSTDVERLKSEREAQDEW